MPKVKIHLRPSVFNVIKFIILQCIWVPILDLSIEYGVKLLVTRNLNCNGFSLLERQRPFLHRISGGFFLPQGASLRARAAEDDTSEKLKLRARRLCRNTATLFFAAFYLLLNGALEFGADSENEIRFSMKNAFIFDNTTVEQYITYYPTLRRFKKAMRQCMQRDGSSLTVDMPIIYQEGAGRFLNPSEDYSILQCGLEEDALPWLKGCGKACFSDMCIFQENMEGKRCASFPSWAFKSDALRSEGSPFGYPDFLLRVDLISLWRQTKTYFPENLIRVLNGRSVCPQLRPGVWVGFLLGGLQNSISEFNVSSGNLENRSHFLIAFGDGENLSYGIGKSWNGTRNGNEMKLIDLKLQSEGWAQSRIKTRFEVQDETPMHLFEGYQSLFSGESLSNFWYYGFEEFVMTSLGMFGFYGNASRYSVRVKSDTGRLLSTVEDWAFALLGVSASSALAFVLCADMWMRKHEFIPPTTASDVMRLWKADGSVQIARSLASEEDIGIGIEHRECRGLTVSPRFATANSQYILS